MVTYRPVIGCWELNCTKSDDNATELTCVEQLQLYLRMPPSFSALSTRLSSQQSCLPNLEAGDRTPEALLQLPILSFTVRFPSNTQLRTTTEQYDSTGTLTSLETELLLVVMVGRCSDLYKCGTTLVVGRKGGFLEVC